MRHEIRTHQLATLPNRSLIQSTPRLNPSSVFTDSPFVPRLLVFDSDVGTSRDPLPALGAEALDRLETDLVTHLAAVADPIAKVDVGEAVAHRLSQQPHDPVAAEAARWLAGIQEAVDGRYTVFAPVRQHAGDEATDVVAEFHQAGVDRRILDHGTIIRQTHPRHLAVAVAAVEILLEQLI